jgi:DNA-binding transcriptional MerR regulator
MRYFTIKDIENLSGIKAHTLRIWEQRYQLFVSKRKESPQHFYGKEDLKQALRIAFLYHHGWKVSKISTLNADQIAEEVRKAEIGSTSYEKFIIKMIEAAIDFNEAAFLRIIDELIGKIGFEKCITEVCYPYLNRIGILSVTNNVIPAQEHFSSYIIKNKITVETEKFQTNNQTPGVLLFSPKREYHELPLLFINYLLRKNGWSVIYLGSSITKKVLKQFIDKEELHYLFLHIVTNFPGWDADVYFEDVCRAFPTKTIVATGAATHQVQRNFINLMLLKSDKDIYDFIERKTKRIHH